MVQLILCLLVIFSLWLLSKRFYFGKEFVIRIKPSKLLLLKGSAPKNFLSEALLISKQNKVYGLIFGVKTQYGLTLKFSPKISGSNAQRFRNVFPFELYSSRQSHDGDNQFPRKRAR